MFSFRNSNSACGPVGIDCGSDALRLLQLRTVAGGTITSHLEVSVAREQPLAPLARRDSGAAWIRAAEEAAEGWRTARFRSSRFVLSLPAPRTQFQIVSLPSLARADFERASQWEASDRFGMDHGDLCATALPTNAPATTDGKGECLLVAVEQSFVEAMLEPFLRRGLEPVAVEPRFASAARAASRHARREADRSRVRGVVLVGRDETTILVLRGDEIAFARELPSGNLAIDQAISERLGLSMEDASLLRQEIALSPSTPFTSHAAQAARDAARPVLAMIANEATMCFRYYSVRFRGGTPSSVLVLGSGDGALSQEIKQASGIATAVDDERSSFQTLALSLSEANVRSDSALWLAAYGAACKSSATPRAAQTTQRDAA